MKQEQIFIWSLCNAILARLFHKDHFKFYQKFLFSFLQILTKI